MKPFTAILVGYGLIWAAANIVDIAELLDGAPPPEREPRRPRETAPALSR